MKRCSYCGKKINGSVGFCSDACESRYKKVMEKDGPKVKYFISGIILGFTGDVLWNYIKQQLPDRDGKHSNRN
ncbi:MAG: DUF2116 family Zn-ribbon domain-containing protein [Blautia sp.]